MNTNLTELERAVILACKNHFTGKFDGYETASNIITQLIYGNPHPTIPIIQIANVKEILRKARSFTIEQWDELETRLMFNAYSSCHLRHRLEITDFLQEVFYLYCSELACLAVYSIKNDTVTLDLTISNELENKIRSLTIS